MRIWLMIGLLAACGKSAKSQDVLATLDEPKSTPVSLQVAGGKLYVVVDRGDPGMKLLEIDAASRATREVASSLPAGVLSVHGGKLYFGAYAGSVGMIDPASGALTVVAKLDHAIQGMTGTEHGFLVGGEQTLVAIDDKGTAHDIAGAPIGPKFSGVDQLASTALGTFAASRTGDTVVRIDGDTAVILADHQVHPTHLTAGGDQVAWTTEDLTRLMGVAPTGGQPTVLAQATRSQVIQAVASDGTTIACSMLGADGGGGIYLVQPGSEPRQLVEARASLLAVAGKSVYWIEPSGGAYLVKTATF